MAIELAIREEQMKWPDLRVHALYTLSGTSREGIGVLRGVGLFQISCKEMSNIGVKLEADGFVI